MSGSWFEPDWGCIVVSGPDAASWLQGILTCDVRATDSGNAVWGTLLTKQGKVQNEVFVMREDDSLYLALVGGDRDACLATLDGLLVMEDAEIEMCTGRFFLEVQAGDAEDKTSHPSSHPCPAFGGDVRLHRVADHVLTQTRSLMTGKAMSDEEFDAFRIRRGIPKYGVDYGPADNLHAAGLERRVVDWTKGCYLGQEVVCMQEMRGKVRRRVVALTLDEAVTHVLAAPLEVESEVGESVGQCSSLWGDHAIARVSAGQDAPGTRLHLNCSGQKVGAVVRG